MTQYEVLQMLHFPLPFFYIIDCYRKLSTAHRGSDTKSSSFRKLLSFKRSQKLRQEQLEYLCDTTKISEGEIKLKYKTFLESHPAGEISHDSFNALLSECFPKTYLENIRYLMNAPEHLLRSELKGLFLTFPLRSNFPVEKRC